MPEEFNMATCPCCGYKVFLESQAYEICPICRWEDDPIQLADPWYAGGANHPSLQEAQNNFAECGACEKRSQSSVRSPSPDDQIDQEWRLLNESDRQLLNRLENEPNADKAVPLEYWKRKA
jgi:hypothetical protein